MNKKLTYINDFVIAILLLPCGITGIAHTHYKHLQIALTISPIRICKRVQLLPLIKNAIRQIITIIFLTSSLNTFASEYYITTSNLNLRNGAGKNYKCSTIIAKGAPVLLINKAENNWVKNKHDDKIDYSSKQYLQKIPTSKALRNKEPKENKESISYFILIGFITLIITTLIYTTKQDKNENSENLDLIIKDSTLIKEKLDEVPYKNYSHISSLEALNDIAKSKKKVFQENKQIKPSLNIDSLLYIVDLYKKGLYLNEILDLVKDLNLKMPDGEKIIDINQIILLIKSKISNATFDLKQNEINNLSSKIDSDINKKQDYMSFKANDEQIVLSKKEHSKYNIDNSIIEINSEDFDLTIESDNINNQSDLEPPFWKNTYIYSYKDIKSANKRQKEFYFYFKNKVINGEFVDIKENTNYAFILYFDLLNEKQDDLVFLQNKFDLLINICPAIAKYSNNMLVLLQIKQEMHLNTNEQQWLSLFKLNSNKFNRIKHNYKQIIISYLQILNLVEYDLKQINSSVENEVIKISSFNNEYFLETRKDRIYMIISKRVENYIRALNGEKEMIKAIYTERESLSSENNFFEDHLGKIINEKISNLLIIKNKTFTTFSNHLYQNDYSNIDYSPDAYKLGKQYKDKLGLNIQEEAWLNKFWTPSNIFISIEGCCIATIKQYLQIVENLNKVLKNQDTSIIKEVNYFKEKILEKKENTDIYWGIYDESYINQRIESDIYLTIFKRVENSVREFYNHKRKVSSLPYFDFNGEFEIRIGNYVDELVIKHQNEIVQPDIDTQIKLNAQNVNRWKIEFNNLKNCFQKEDTIKFIDGILKLEKVNQKNPNIENIFYEASKFISKYDKIQSLKYYIIYIYYNLKSKKLDFKELTKTVEKSLFKTDEQINYFKRIIAELIETSDIQKALEDITKIYIPKRKKIKLDKVQIKEVEQKYNGTVELLSEYLDIEDNKTDQKKSEKEELETSIIPNNLKNSIFIPVIKIGNIQAELINMIVSNSFKINQKEVDKFATANGLFKNQLIDSINEAFEEHLEGEALIEEDNENYIIEESYYKEIII